MKKMTCDLCDVVAHGETFEEWMANIKPHYMGMHADVINDPHHTKEDMQKWMELNKMRFDKEKEID